MRSKSFTLVEICLVIALLALTSVALCWGAKHMIDAHGVDAAGQRFHARIRELQVIAMMRQTYLALDVCQEGAVMKVATDEPLALALKSELKFNKSYRWRFNGKPISTLRLEFFPTGKIEPSGVMKVEHREEKRGLEIDWNQQPYIEIRRSKDEANE